MKNIKFPSLIISAVIITLFITYLVHYSTGIPKSDDYPMMIIFLDHWNQSNTFYQKYLLLTEQFVNHRMLAMKLTVLAVSAVYGKLNINLVNSVGIMLWFATLYILYRAHRSAKLPPISFLPVLLLTLHPGYGFEGLLWAATWMAFPWAIFLSLMTFYLLLFHHSKTSFAFALALALFALFSHGNGIFTILIALFILIAQKAQRLALIWTITSCLGLFLFFFNYTDGNYAAPPLQNLIERPVYVISSIGAFVGASLFFPDTEIATINTENVSIIIFGLILCLSISVYSLFVFWRLFKNLPIPIVKSSTKSLLLFCCSISLFIVITAAMLSLVRVYEDFLLGLAGRYHFYSALMISVVYLLFLALLPEMAGNKRFQILSITLGTIYCLSQYWFQTSDFANQVRAYQAGLYNSQKSGKWVVYGDAILWERGVNSYSNKILWPDGSPSYKFPDVALQPSLVQTKAVNLSQLSDKNFVVIEDKEDSISIYIRGPEFQVPAFKHVTDGTYMYLVSQTNSFLFPFYQEREGLRQFLANQIYYKPAGHLSLKKKWFKPGTYNLYIYVTDFSRKVLINTQKSIEISSLPVL